MLSFVVFLHAQLHLGHMFPLNVSLKANDYTTVPKKDILIEGSIYLAMSKALQYWI